MSKSNGWTSNIERLLQNWSKQVTVNEHEYRKRGAYHRRWYIAFGIFLIVGESGALTVLINDIVAIIYKDAKNDDNCEGVAIGSVLIIVAIMMTLILIAQGIDKFFNFGSRSEKFYEAAKDHTAFARLIDATIISPREDRDPAREVLMSIRFQFDQIQFTSPNLPPNIMIHGLEMLIYNDPQEAKGILCSKSERNIIEMSPPPQIPDKTEIVTLPNPLPSEESDNVSHQRRFGAQLQAQKALDYQWRRFERHAEDHLSENSNDIV